jgi:hypothetical protein
LVSLYAGGCAAAWVLARRGVERAGTPLNFRYLGTATVIGVVSLLCLIGLGSRQEIFGLVVLIGLSGLLYRIQTHIASHRTVSP